RRAAAAAPFCERRAAAAARRRAAEVSGFGPQRPDGEILPAADPQQPLLRQREGGGQSQLRRPRHAAPQPAQPRRPQPRALPPAPALCPPSLGPGAGLAGASVRLSSGRFVYDGHTEKSTVGGNPGVQMLELSRVWAGGLPRGRGVKGAQLPAASPPPP
uniref:Uncharacterized protein n=1 Tax=Mustela putorius furo TaxID=9669 RepID=M3Y6D1_MUSPF